MKTIMLALLVVSFALGGCATTFHTTGEIDGIYYTPRATRLAGGGQQAELARVARDEVYHDQQYQYDEYTEYQYADPQAYHQEDDFQTRNWYYSESQYDFSYAARIRRFHRPNYRWAYFDPWFTNMFWYTHNPMYFGVSIYAGFGALNFYYPGFMFWHPTFYWYSWVTPFHWYSPIHFWSNHWAWHRWSPWWGSRWGMHTWSHAFWSGFHAGFHSGFHHGWWSNPFNYQYIYNSHDRNNYVYGHRGATGTIVGTGSNRREDRNATFAERFEARGRTEPPATPDPNLNERNRSGRGTIGDGRVLPAPAAAPGTERGRERIPETGQTPREVRDRTGEGTTTGPREQPGRVQTPERATPADRQVRGEPGGNINREPGTRAPERTGPETRPAVPQRQPETRPAPAPAPRQPETRPAPAQRQPETRPAPAQRQPETGPAPAQRQPEFRPDTPQREPEARPVRPERTPEDFRASSPSDYQSQAIERFERQSQPQREVQPQGSNPEPNRPRTYTPPSHQRPRSEQEYSRPQTTRPQGTQRPETINRPESRPESQPERTMTMPRPTQQTRPSGQERSQPTFTQPSRPQSSPRSAPARTAPAPQRQPSGGSMSTPPPSRGSSGSSGSSSERGRQ